MSDLHAIWVKPQTDARFDAHGSRNDSDDDILMRLLDIADRVKAQGVELYTQ